MFGRSRRISRAEFSRPGFLHGSRASSPHLSVVFPRDTRGYAVVISKKTIKLSVKRHVLKRRILEALRKLPHLPPGLVVYPKASALTLPFVELQKELALIVGKSGLAR